MFSAFEHLEKEMRLKNLPKNPGNKSFDAWIVNIDRGLYVCFYGPKNYFERNIGKYLINLNPSQNCTSGPIYDFITKNPGEIWLYKRFPINATLEIRGQSIDFHVLRFEDWVELKEEQREEWIKGEKLPEGVNFLVVKSIS